MIFKKPQKVGHIHAINSHFFFNALQYMQNWLGFDRRVVAAILTLYIPSLWTLLVVSFLVKSMEVNPHCLLPKVLVWNSITFPSLSRPFFLISFWPSLFSFILSLARHLRRSDEKENCFLAQFLVTSIFFFSFWDLNYSINLKHVALFIPLVQVSQNSFSWLVATNSNPKSTQEIRIY